MSDPTKQMTDAVQASTKQMTEAGQAGMQQMTEAGQAGMKQMTEAGQAGTKQMTEAGQAMQANTKQMAERAQEAGRSAIENGMAKMNEFTRMFKEMKMPAMLDMESIMAAHRKNMEVLSNANRVALEGAQKVARRHMEILQQTMQEMTETMKELSGPETPQAKAAKQTELMKIAYERAVTHMKELADLIQRSNGEALGMLNARFTEAMDEVKQLASKASTAA